MSLFDLLAGLLAEVEDIYTDEGLTLPDRRYVAEGGVALDCPEQMTVEFVSARHGPTGGDEPARIYARCSPTSRSVSMLLMVTRCAAPLPQGGPTVQFPSAESIEAVAEDVMTQAWTVFDRLTARIVEGDYLSQCQGARLGPLARFGPEGGAVGFTLAVEVDL